MFMVFQKSIAMNRSMRYHWNFHHTTDEVLNGGEGDTLGELEKVKFEAFSSSCNRCCW